jgi:protein-S-isoprenylcysteine O-methyltransferase Ste14
MHLEYYTLGTDLWFAICIIWLIGRLFSKRSVRTQTPGTRLPQAGLAAVAGFLVFSRYFHVGSLAARFLPDSDTAGAVGLLFTFLGLAVAVWARLPLGHNWSGTVTVKEDHQLIRRGPYAIVRHPIYTGFLVGFVGMALIIGEVRGLLGVAVLFVAFLLKSRTEEGFMRQQFGAQYTQYQHDVKALIPFIY